MNNRFIDLFCGLGGFRIGFERHGFECVFSSDINSHIQKTYEANFGEKPYGDITQIDPKQIPEFDILLGGFPCQPFSISGKKKGFEDTRGTLFFDICKIIEQHKPKVVVLENVKHLIYHNKKRTLATIISTLKDLGYYVDHRLLNAKDFGLPQNRERIFIIATQIDFFDFDKLRRKQAPSLSAFLDKDGNHEYLNESEYTLLPKGMYKRQFDSGLIFIGYRNKNIFKRGIRPGTLHLNRVHRQPNRIYSVEGNHPTLPSQETSGRFFIYEPDKNKVRKLTIRECFRIMGFPENYRRISPYGEQFKQIGNSVPINVVESIASAMVQQELSDVTRTQREVVRNIQGGARRQLEFTA